MFLDAHDQVLVNRYKETRRTHPLAPKGLPLEGIRLEREMLEELKGRAQIVYDTSNLKPRELREKILKQFAENGDQTFTLNVLSFGFKYGLPIDADLVFDVRFLPNPYYIDHMRPKTGLDEEVSSYVLKWTETSKFLEKLTDLLSFMILIFKEKEKVKWSLQSVALADSIAR